MDRLVADCPLKSVRYYLAEIHQLIAVHFEDEEEVMRTTGYNGATAHKIDHDRLLLRIRAILDELEQGRPDMSKRQLARTLDDWFSVHFRTYDRAFHRLSEEASEKDVSEASVARPSD
jgi:hemerythrin-like metal-binding protein